MTWAKQRMITYAAILVLAFILTLGVKAGDALPSVVLQAAFIASIIASVGIIYGFTLSHMRLKKVIAEINARADIRELISREIAIQTVRHVATLALYAYIVTGYAQILF